MGESDRPAGESEARVLSYVDVRNRHGKLMFRYDPIHDLIEIRFRGAIEVVDLSLYIKRYKHGVDVPCTLANN